MLDEEFGWACGHSGGGGVDLHRSEGDVKKEVFKITSTDSFTIDSNNIEDNSEFSFRLFLLLSTAKKVVTEIRARVKVARLLFNIKLPRASKEIALPQLEELHPQEDVAAFPHPTHVPQFYVLAPETVAKIIMKVVGRAAAPLLDGWTRELLVPLIEDPSLLLEITTVIKDLLAANVSESFAYRLHSAVIHPFLKDSSTNKIWPITPESIWPKIASLIALKMVEVQVQHRFHGWHYGLGGDVELAVEKIRQAYKLSNNDTFVALDATNAYNRMNRKVILERVYGNEALTPIYGLIEMALGKGAQLGLYEDDKLLGEVNSTRGVRQGMVLAPLLFSLGLQTVMKPLINKHNKVSVIAYFDDITVVGKRNLVQAFLNDAGPLLDDLGYNINPKKSIYIQKELFIPAFNKGNNNNFKYNNDDDEEDGGGNRNVSHHDAEGEEQNGDSHITINNHNVCGITVNMESIPRSDTTKRILGAGIHPNNAMVTDYVKNKYENYTHYFSTLSNSRLPKSAKMTLLRGATIPKLNFLLRTHTYIETSEVAKDFDNKVQAMLSTLVDNQTLAEKAKLIMKLPLNKGGLGLRSQSELTHFAHDCVGVPQEQRRRTEELDATIIQLLTPLLSEPESEVLAANSKPGATRVLADPAIKLGVAAYTVMLKQRLMMRILASSTKCMCGHDATNDHVNTCQKQYGGARIDRHNGVVYALQTWAQQLGYAVTIEPRTSEVNKHRMDLIIHTQQGTYATDVSVVYPARAKQNMSGAMQQYKMEELKWTIWAQECGAYFAPFILESTGGIHHKSLQWLTALAGVSPHPYNTRTAVSEALVMVIKSLHQGNARLYCLIRDSWNKRLMYPSVILRLEICKVYVSSKDK